VEIRQEKTIWQVSSQNAKRGKTLKMVLALKEGSEHSMLIHGIDYHGEE